MQNILHFSVLTYSPSFVTNELINLGVLFNYNNKFIFKITENFKSVKDFDNEINIDMLKLSLSGIKNELESNVFNCDSNISFENYIKEYRNEFRFSEINSFHTENPSESIEKIKQIYLRFDYNR